MKNALLFSAAAGILILSGCVQQPDLARLNNANQKFIAEAAQCVEGELTEENALKRRDCVDQARTRHMTEGGFPYMELVTKLNAANRAAAVQYAEHKTSKVEYTASIAQNQAEYSQQYQKLHAADMKLHADPFGGIFGYSPQSKIAAPGIATCADSQNNLVCETP
jgi:hypothetical protein